MHACFGERSFTSHLYDSDHALVRSLPSSCIDSLSPRCNVPPVATWRVCPEIDERAPKVQLQTKSRGL